MVFRAKAQNVDEKEVSFMLDMNQIDFAISAYKGAIPDSEYDRLVFFRSLWEAQASAQAQYADSVSYQVPTADELKDLGERSVAILKEFPAKIDPRSIASTSAEIAALMSAFEQFDASTRESLAKVSWDRIVSASDTTLAGSDPAAYVDACEGLLIDDGLSADAARIGASAISLALRALLQGAAEAIQSARIEGKADQPYPTHCPVCASPAGVARVGGGGKTKGRSRTLWCPQCGCVWDFERVRCARCGTQNQGHLHFFNVEGDDNHRIQTCDECGGYIRTVYEEDDPLKNLYPFSFEVEDVLMARLDLIAYRQLVAQEEQASEQA